MKTLFARPGFRWLVWALAIGAWTTLLLIPIPQSGPLSLAEMNPSRRHLVAKFLHVAIYTFLTGLSGWLPTPLRFRWVLLFFLMAHASVTELLQIPAGRGGSLYDVGYDHLGVFVGLLLTWKWWSRPDAVAPASPEKS